MSNQLIQKEYIKKVKLINYYNKKYYDENISEITDAEYDLLKREIVDLEKKNKFLKSKESPSNKIGHKPSKNFKKSKHKVPMLSLSNAFNEEDLLNFEKKLLNFLSKNNNSNISYTAEPKIDGISASLTYLNGKLKLGLSRGDGKEGEDITSNLFTIKDIPKIILSKDFPEEIDIRGEVFIQNSDFDILKEKFANPRNAASGSLRQKKTRRYRKNTFKIYCIHIWFSKRFTGK